MNELATHLVEFDNGDKLFLTTDLDTEDTCIRLYEVNCGNEHLVDTFSDRLEALDKLAWKVGTNVVYGRTLVTHYSD